MNRILKFYTQLEFDAFASLLQSSQLAEKLLLSSIDKVGAFYPISNPCKVEDAIKKGTRVYSEGIQDYEAKGLEQDKLYGFIQYDGIKFPVHTEDEILASIEKAKSNSFNWNRSKADAIRTNMENVTKPLRIYVDITASNGYFWTKKDRPKSIRLDVNSEGIFCKEISF